MTFQLRTLIKGLPTQIEQMLTQSSHRHVRCGKRLAPLHVDMGPHQARRLEKVAIPRKRKQGAPKPVVRYRHHRHPCFARHDLITALQLHQLSRAGDTALRKNHDQFTSLEVIHHGTGCREGVLRRNRDRSAQFEDQSKNPTSIFQPVEGHKTQRSGAGQLQGHGVNVREVIHRNDGSSLGQVFCASRLHAVKASGNGGGDDLHYPGQSRSVEARRG